MTESERLQENLKQSTEELLKVWGFKTIEEANEKWQQLKMVREVERLLNEFIVTTDYSLIIKLKELMRYSLPEKVLNKELCIKYKSVMNDVYKTISQKKYQDITDPDERWLWEGYELDYY